MTALYHSIRWMVIVFFLSIIDFRLLNQPWIMVFFILFSWQVDGLKCLQKSRTCRRFSASKYKSQIFSWISLWINFISAVWHFNSHADNTLKSGFLNDDVDYPDVLIFNYDCCLLFVLIVNDTSLYFVKLFSVFPMPGLRTM